MQQEGAVQGNKLGNERDKLRQEGMKTEQLRQQNITVAL
jgi:hypothetical protein